MFRKAKGKSSPIHLVSPGDVISAQQLLRVEQDSLKLFLQRGYNSYTFLGVYALFGMLVGGSCVWLCIERDIYRYEAAFISLEAAISVLATIEAVWRLSLNSIWTYIREPLHWVDLSLLVLWFTALALLRTDQFKYHFLILSIQMVFLARILVLSGSLLRRLRVAYASSNILHIPQLPGEVEIIALDESQASQMQQSARQEAELKIEKQDTFFRPKCVEIEQKSESAEPYRLN
jgi:hypothetical protein